jgi:hypothetical protein
MLPDLWLANDRIRKLRMNKFPSQPKSAFIRLAESMFGGFDLSRTQLSAMVKALSEATEWPRAAREPEEDDIDPATIPVRPDATPDNLLAAIGMLVNIQSGTSVLDLYCGAGTFTQLMALNRCYYEGHEVDPDAVAQAKRVLGTNGQVYQTDLTSWVDREPDSQYGLVFAHPPVGLTTTCQYPCLEMQGGGQIDMELATYEIAVKSCIKGGFVVILTESGSFGLDEYVKDWLAEHGTLIADLVLGVYNLVVFRNGVKTPYDALTGVVVSEDGLIELCSERTPIRTPICSDDPRPMVLKTWDIEVVPNGEAFGTVYGKRHVNQPDAELYKSKGRVGIRWARSTVAMEWAQHQSLTAPQEESWVKTQDRFSRRLLVDTYIDVRLATDPNDILNLPRTYTVGEESALKKFMDRTTSKAGRLATSYPEKSTLENRYYTLGPGSMLLRGDERWAVSFSEPDFSNSKPPKVHIQKV